MHYLPINASTIRLELLLSAGTNSPKWDSKNKFSVVETKNISEIHTIQIVDFLVEDEDCIEFRNYGKTENDTVIVDGQIIKDQCIEITKIWVNNIQIEKHFVEKSSKFCPMYQRSNIEYAVKHNIELPTITHEIKFYYNGIWQFNFTQPFFKWYNHLVLKDLDNLNHWVKQTHLGLGNPDLLFKLENILIKL